MNDLARIEFDTLRKTIRERGTLRVWLLVAGSAVWGALVIALAAADSPGAVTLVPFAILAGTFEAIYSLHTSVERIGRYLQVFYEDTGVPLPAWESTSMAYGRRYTGGLDPLFVAWFVMAGVLNFLSILSALTPGSRRSGWVLIALIVHGGFAWRLKTARTAAVGQRAVDLERFNALKREERKTT